MRRTIAVLVLLAALLLLLDGCASVSNLGTPDGWKVYGGTRTDASLVSEGFSPPPQVAESKKIERPILVWEGCCGLVDMPFSLAADTLLLPVTVPIAVARLTAEPEVPERPTK
jgi:uncharacterized protein YceK